MLEKIIAKHCSFADVRYFTQQLGMLALNVEDSKFFLLTLLIIIYLVSYGQSKENVYLLF